MRRHRDVMGSPFSSPGSEDMEMSDPSSGLTNLADCMLVLACGLMVALVVHWNLNLTPKYEVLEETGELVEIEEGNEPEPAIVTNGQTSSSDTDDGVGENVYENMGTLYRDSATGKFYYILPEEE